MIFPCIVLKGKGWGLESEYPHPMGVIPPPPTLHLPPVSWNISGKPIKKQLIQALIWAFQTGIHLHSWVERSKLHL
jgi:hypothetical protein